MRQGLASRAVEIDSLFEPPADAVVVQAWPGSARRAGHLPGGTVQWLLDDFGAERCVFVRAAAGTGLQLSLAGVRGITLAAAGGWLIQTEGAAGATYWLPAAPTDRALDEVGHVQAEQAARICDAGVNGAAASVSLAVPVPGMASEFAIWRVSSAAADELRQPLALERQGAYLWGSHTRFEKLADLSRHLVHGHVYEDRYAWPFNLRICSENDAHALYVQLVGLQRAAGRTMAGVLARQLALSVASRLGPDGAFRHGEWTDRMESHYRLHCSGMHLMMDALAEAPSAELERALRAAAAFLAKQHELIDAGVWFFHDELEHSTEALRRGPFKWLPSTALGKRESNMLVLNTQLDSSIALDRYAQTTGDRQFAALVESARAATQAVLALRPAERFYRGLLWLVELSFLPTKQASALPMWKRALKRLTWKYVIPRMPDIKVRLPRLVMPGGYIDRELALRTWAHDYHAVNLMDLARYLRRFDDPVVRQVLLDGLAFTRRSGILQRWQELGYQKYALGFWAEALYHVCTLFPDATYRQWLAEAMMLLEDQKMGQPPSLLGANAEAVPVAQQMPCPSPVDARLRVANLGRLGAPELLVVNASDDSIAMNWEAAPLEAVTLYCPDGRESVGKPPMVPARGWLWARPPA